MNDGYPQEQPLTRAGLLARLTGAATLAAGALLYGDGTANLQTLAAGTAGRVLVAQGAAAPQWVNIYGQPNTWTVAQTFSATARFNAAEAIGLGVAPTAGNGLLQFAAGTSRATGLAFGPDVFFHRKSANVAALSGGIEINNDRANGYGYRLFDLATGSKFVRCDGNNYQILNNGFTTVLLSIDDVGQVTLGSSNTNVHNLNTATATTVGAAGGASALPATPTGYVRMAINGTIRKVPFYAD